MEPSRRLAVVWGAFVARHRWYVLAVWLLLVLGLAGFAASTARNLSPAGFETDTQAARAADVLKSEFPERRAPALAVVFQSDSAALEDASYRSQLAAWRLDLERLARQTSAPQSPTVVVGPIPSQDRRSAALLLESNEQPAYFLAAAREASGIHHEGPARVFIGGFAAVYNNFVMHSEQDLGQSERLSAPLALILLLLVFGGVVAGALPVLTGLGTVTVALALLGFVARIHTVSVFSLNVTSVVGLGLGIDYSLLVVNRFREELRAGADPETAVARTVGTAGVATVVSGGTVAIGFGALMLSHLNVLWSIGLGGSLVVVVSVLASLTLIPALLAVFGARVDSLALPFTRNRSLAGFWRGLAGSVMRRPLVFIVITLGVILLLASPARALRPGVLGSESLPPDDGAVQAQALGESRLGFARQQPAILVARGVGDLNQAQ
ncbi:MAG: MMPL family transporter, partial [Candidatus Dormibacteraeota bacterium]|nr:MMPL family transporter [Candidatus Dormibacteraeota bacterium]